MQELCKTWYLLARLEKDWQILIGRLGLCVPSYLFKPLHIPVCACKRPRRLFVLKQQYRAIYRFLTFSSPAGALASPPPPSLKQNLEFKKKSNPFSLAPSQTAAHFRELRRHAASIQGSDWPLGGSSDTVTEMRNVTDRIDHLRWSWCKKKR